MRERGLRDTDVLTAMQTQHARLRGDRRPAGFTDGKGRETQERLLAERAGGRVEGGAQCIEDVLQGTSQVARSRPPGQCRCCRNVRCQSSLTAEDPPLSTADRTWGSTALPRSGPSMHRV